MYLTDRRHQFVARADARPMRLQPYVRPEIGDARTGSWAPWTRTARRSHRLGSRRRGLLAAHPAPAHPILRASPLAIRQSTPPVQLAPLQLHAARSCDRIHKSWPRGLGAHDHAARRPQQRARPRLREYTAFDPPRARVAAEHSSISLCSCSVSS